MSWFRATTVACLATVLAAGFHVHHMAAQGDAIQAPEPARLQVPPGFSVSVFASGLTGARLMAVSPEGTLVLARRTEVVALPDVDRDGRAEPVVLLSGLGYAHSVAFMDGYLYVGTTAAVKRVPWKDGGLAGDLEDFAELPSSTPALHSSRSIAFGPDGRLYVSAGSSCNVCVEPDARRTTIQVFDAAGRGRAFAVGLRNAVGFDWDPRTGRMWAADIAQDRLGDDRPLEEIDLIEEGRHYGFPFFYGRTVANPADELKDVARTVGPADVVPPRLELPAHTTPLGVAFYRGTTFPEPYRSSLYVALHGSTTTAIKVGYRVERIVMENGEPVRHEPFVTGWLDGDVVAGRPAGVITGADDALYVSDDRGGFVYRVVGR